ncbi:MAG: cell wall hydrolase, partial [Myxococcales bacterium]|nr:cell wall hydrolase [Myxococcales bacterium]
MPLWAGAWVAEKTGRIVSVAPAAPPRDFSAGSVLERQSRLILQPSFDRENLMAFAKPSIGGKEIQIATAFHKRRDPVRDTQVPVMLASLVTNDKADSLATAYAPSKPDFASQSPFRSLLKEPDGQKSGRFIPPVPRSDHAWARTPLPPVVFTSNEQKCLAEGIYFEARGEKVKGQAAVAQVILNRVRNPAFPAT